MSSPQFVFKHFLSVKPVFAMIPINNNTTGVKFSNGFKHFILWRYHII